MKLLSIQTCQSGSYTIIRVSYDDRQLTSSTTHRIHGTRIFADILDDVYGELIGKYTSHMDPMGMNFPKKRQFLIGIP